MSKKIARFPLNTAGRDFIIGDVHGAFDLVLSGMARVGFDPGKDRLFSVGDLVDRGPQSARAFRFLSQPYVHAVRGNHEQNLLDLYERGDPDEQVLEVLAHRFGLGWWLALDAARRAQILAAFRRLPVVIEVATSRGTVGIVHADIPVGMDWATFVAAVDRDDGNVMTTALEGRGRIKAQCEDGVCGIGRVYVGHTPQWGGARRYGNVYAMDTGAIFGQIFEDHEGHLTMADMAFATSELSIPRETVDAIDAILDDNASMEKPFGNYAV